MILKKAHSVKNTQWGNTLIIALILLGVMAILSVSTLKSSTLQERMAGNARQSVVALASAESALREAEQWLTNEVNTVSRLTNHFITSPTQGCYADRELPILAPVAIRKLSDSIADLTSQKSWMSDTTTSRTAGDLNSDWTDGDWARSPRVVIELLGPVRSGSKDVSTGSVQNMDAGYSPSIAGPWVFRLTAIGWSKDPDIYRVLQTTYTTGKQFGG